MDRHKSTHACVSLQVLPVLKCHMKRLTIKRIFGICWTEKPIKAKQKHFDDGGERRRVRRCKRNFQHIRESETEIQQPKWSSLCQHAKCGDQRHFHFDFSGLLHYSSPQQEQRQNHLQRCTSDAKKQGVRPFRYSEPLQLFHGKEQLLLCDQ